MLSLPTRKILLVEDEPGLSLTLYDLLRSEGYQVESAEDGLTGLMLAGNGDFDVVILDVMLPGKNGFDVCRDLRQQGIATPILMLTARGQIVDKVLGLKLGADDYLTKPFDSMELLARVEALLRRAPATASQKQDESFHFGHVTVDFRSTEVRRDGKLIEMSAREFELLCYLIRQRGATISRGQLLREVWGYDEEALTRTVDMHMALLRQKLEADARNPRHFLTVRGLGYKFVDGSV
ncbi:MAG TPA: response regulator transcription factor [Blastocatellia bacterium]|nr:response regulator transcription factor [Blastocatellia bacterium]